MKNLLLMIAMGLLLGACGQQKNSTGDAVSASENEEIKVVAATVEELLATPDEYLDKEVALKGMVTHVCRHGGQKCFIVGADGETQIRIVPGGDIDEFKVDLEGSTVAFKGTFKVLNTEAAQAHVEDHEAQEHHDHEMPHTEAEKADYYIEASSHKEVQP